MICSLFFLGKSVYTIIRHPLIADRYYKSEEMEKNKKNKRKRGRAAIGRRHRRNVLFFIMVILCIGLFAVLLGLKKCNKLNGDTTTSSVSDTANESGKTQNEVQTELENAPQTEGGGDLVPDISADLEREMNPAIEPELMDSATITISAIGDCTLGTDVNFDPNTSFDTKYQEKGYPGYFFENVVDILGADHLTIANFEGTLTDRGSRKEKTFAFRGKPEYTAILTEGSVEAVNLANNHSFDYGEVSYEDTKQYMKDAGITCFGYDNNAVIEVNGVSVGLIGIYELADGIGCADLLKENLAAVKDQGAQLIIVSFHWGTEKEHYPDGIQKELAHTAIDYGAHLVLGHHPHVLQGIEEYQGRNIVYSLGNFCFGGNKNPSDKDTMIFQQTFQIIDGEVADDNMKEIIPCSLSSRSDRNNYQPMVLYGEDAERVLGRIRTYSEGL